MKRLAVVLIFGMATYVIVEQHLRNSEPAMAEVVEHAPTQDIVVLESKAPVVVHTTPEPKRRFRCEENGKKRHIQIHRNDRGRVKSIQVIANGHTESGNLNDHFKVESRNGVTYYRYKGNHIPCDKVIKIEPGQGRTSFVISN